MAEIALDIANIEQQSLDLELIKEDLRIAHGDLDQTIIEQYLPAAIQRAEAFMKRSVVARQHVWIIDEFPCHALVLPRGKVSAVISIAYSSGGSVTTLTGPTSTPPGTDYQEDLRGERARIMPLRGAAWPVADCDVPSPIVITYTAGWEADEIPEGIKRGIVAAIGEAMDVPSPALLPAAFDSEYCEKILSAWRIA